MGQTQFMNGLVNSAKNSYASDTTLFTNGLMNSTDKAFHAGKRIVSIVYDGTSTLFP